MNEWKVKQLTIMQNAELERPSENQYGAHLTHWSGKAKPINIDAGALQLLIDYYSQSKHWVLTDDASGQHIRRLSDKQAIFSVIDTIPSTEDGECTVVNATVAIHDEDVQDEDFVQTYLAPFGYASFEEIQEQYGAQAMQIVAECFFETVASEQGRVLYRGSEDACIDYINRNVEPD
ncbi:hypothetical protein LJC33_06530 [Eubacteriales bacterium OttesenSCG-928-N13]|nr:hypothetical protein [Eubacteriales bacterium OttesenSCG-928-N13]